MPRIEEEAREGIRDMVFDFFAEECDVERESISESTDVIEELEGDSLMMLALLRKVCARFGITVELKTLGRHMMRRPASTVGEVLALTYALVEHGDDIVNVEL